MISKELREAIEKMEKLHDALKNIHLLDLIPEIFENQEKIMKHLKSMDKVKEKIDPSDNFKSKIEGK